MTDLIQPSRKGVLRNLYFAGFFLVCIVLWSFHEYEPSRRPAGAQISPISGKPQHTAIYPDRGNYAIAGTSEWHYLRDEYPNGKPEFKISYADTSYYLIGQKQAFQLLAQAILSPDDVSNNQRKELMQWVSTARVLEQRPDSLNQKIKK